VNEHNSALDGCTDESFVATASSKLIRGVEPLNTSWRDQTVNRVWQLAINSEPVSRRGFTFRGDFVRSTGLGQITAELPRFGPLTFPMATATVRFDVPRLGRLALDLQRTYYYEQIVRGNDISANLLTVRWSIPFSGIR